MPSLLFASRHLPTLPRGLIAERLSKHVLSGVPTVAQRLGATRRPCTTSSTMFRAA